MAAGSGASPFHGTTGALQDAGPDRIHAEEREAVEELGRVKLMETLIGQGIVGIITGILTTAVLYLIKVYWSNSVKPFVEATRYQGVMIDGYWVGASKNEDTEKGIIYSNEARLMLRQNAHSLEGEFLFKFTNPHKSFTSEYSVSGYMWEGYITLNFKPKDKRLTSYGTALMKLHNGGHLLIGIWAFRNVESEFVDQTSLSLSREVQNT